MDARRLSREGPSVPSIGLGTVKIGRNTKVKYPTAFDLPSATEVDALLETAWQLGVRLYDTAPAYGQSEARLAPFVGRHRDDMVLTSKCGEFFEDGSSKYDFTRKSLRRSVETSLRRLRTDYLDVLLLHSDRNDVDVLKGSDAVEVLMECKRRGVARLVGISAKSPEGVRLAMPELDVIMAPFSRDDELLATSLQAAHAMGCGILAIKGLGSGHLAQNHGADAAIRHVLEHDFIDCLVMGTLRPEHLAQATSVATQVRGG